MTPTEWELVSVLCVFLAGAVCDFPLDQKSACGPRGPHRHQTGVSFEQTHTVNISFTSQSSCRYKCLLKVLHPTQRLSLKRCTSAGAKSSIDVAPDAALMRQSLLKVHCFIYFHSLLLWGSGHTHTPYK